MYLALQRGQLVHTSDIADRYAISRNHLVKVVHNLVRGGYVKSHRGKGGGIELARDPAEINVGEVVRYTEGPLSPVECFDIEDNRCAISDACRLAGAVEEACESFFGTLDRYVLADLIKRPARLSKALALPAGLD